MKQESKILIGWEEWCELPGLHLPAIKAKIDTGARTSSLHAYNITPFKQDGEQYVRFHIHPIQRNNILSKQCVAKIIDQRHVTSSSGHKELRYVIETTLRLGGNSWPIQLTLSNRDPLIFRMLLGREALKGKVIIDPSKALLTAKIKLKELKRLYL